MDKNFTEKLGQWLNAPQDSKDWEAGALMVLQLSGNRILYNNIMRRIDKSHDTIIYHLQKYYNFRVRELTKDQVKSLEKKVEGIVKNNLSTQGSDEPVKLGRRDDHDSLPDEIKALFVENLSLLQRMRETHLQLRKLSLADSTCPDSERFPFLQDIIVFDKKMRSNWKKYDSYAAE